MDYYNEIDPYAAHWLRNLIDAGHLPYGVVDTRSIEDVCPDELRRYRRCHFFAGIGVWALALEQAGWPDDREVWTGSCPCQPFSTAGKGAGFADERHLWPAWHHLIRECRPPVIFGEQVASKDAGPWIDLVQDDMEALGHAFAAVAFPAASVGAPHIRDRCYWVADDDGLRQQGIGRRRENGTAERCGPCGPCSVADSSPGLEGRDARSLGQQCATAQRSGAAGDLEHTEGDGRQQRRPESSGRGPVGGCGAVRGFWSDADWIACRDGKARPVEPGTFPLAHGVANRVGRLRAYGNAIVAPQARIFIESYLAARAR